MLYITNADPRNACWETLEWGTVENVITMEVVVYANC
jgi:hypothetical protein